MSATRINIAVSVAIPAASLCISRRLYKISACQTVSVTREDVRSLFFVLCSFHVKPRFC